MIRLPTKLLRKALGERAKPPERRRNAESACRGGPGLQPSAGPQDAPADSAGSGRGPRRRAQPPAHFLFGSFFPELLSGFFPRICPLCRRRSLEPREDFCAPCTADFRLLSPPYCSRCGEPLAGESSAALLLCGRCLPACQQDPQTGRLSIRSCAAYAGELRRAILLLKYGRQTWMGAHLGSFLAKTCPRLFPAAVFDRVLPVPLHPRRLRERGFNQCTFLAKPLGRVLRIPVELRAVSRSRYTPPQTALAPAERRRNLAEAFVVHRPDLVRGKTLLMVDDVYTTGATLETLAAALFRAGAHRVCGLTLARTLPGSRLDP